MKVKKNEKLDVWELYSAGKKRAMEVGWEPETETEFAVEAVRFTVFTKDEFGEPSDELDLDAHSAKYARELAEHVLREDYIPGLVITAVEERFGLYL